MKNFTKKLVVITLVITMLMSLVACQRTDNDGDTTPHFSLEDLKQPTKAPTPTVEPTKAPTPTVEPTKAPKQEVESKGNAINNYTGRAFWINNPNRGDDIDEIMATYNDKELWNMEKDEDMYLTIEQLFAVHDKIHRFDDEFPDTSKMRLEDINYTDYDYKILTNNKDAQLAIELFNLTDKDLKELAQAYIKFYALTYHLYPNKDNEIDKITEMVKEVATDGVMETHFKENVLFEVEGEKHRDLFILDYDCFVPYIDTEFYESYNLLFCGMRALICEGGYENGYSTTFCYPIVFTKEEGKWKVAYLPSDYYEYVDSPSEYEIPEVWEKMVNFYCKFSEKYGFKMFVGEYLPKK